MLLTTKLVSYSVDVNKQSLLISATVLLIRCYLQVHGVLESVFARTSAQ